MNSSSKISGYLFVLTGAACYGTMPIFVKLAYQYGADTMTVVTLRFIVATILLWAYLLAFNRKAYRITPRDLFNIALLGIFAFSMASFSYFYSLNFIDVSIAAVLLYTYPAITAVVSLIANKEKIGFIKTASLVITFLGCLILLKAYRLDAVNLNAMGIAMALTSALVISFYMVGSQRLLTRYKSFTILTYTITSAMFGMVVINGKNLIGYFSVSLVVWELIIALAIVATFISLLFVLAGIKRIGATSASIISTLEPVVAVILAFVFLGERLDFVQILGGITVLVGISLVQLEGRSSISSRTAAITGETKTLGEPI